MHVPAFLRERPAWAVHAVVDLARDWIGRFIAVQGIDRAMAIGAQAYTALIPLMIVYASLLPRSGNESFADVLVNRFELTGSTAASVELAFAPAGEVESGVTLLGAGLLLVAALSFTRGMQRLYEGAFGLTKLGMRNTPRGLLWLVVLTVAVSVRPVITDPFEGVTRVVITIAEGVVLWLVTPSLLLGRRVPWRRLVAGAVLTAVGMTGVAIWSAIWMPHTIATSAKQYGVIGIGFAMLTWLVAVSTVLVVATTGGAMISDRIDHRRRQHA